MMQENNNNNKAIWHVIRQTSRMGRKKTEKPLRHYFMHVHKQKQTNSLVLGAHKRPETRCNFFLSQHKLFLLMLSFLSSFSVAVSFADNDIM